MDWERLFEKLLHFITAVSVVSMVQFFYFDYLKIHHHTNLFAWVFMFWFVVIGVVFLFIQIPTRRGK